ncbi:MAG TPA: CAP domain-containing protein [Nitrososphaera sp.]|nr:CAP domain-containing protein [Nitrososphaera sp.]
MITKQGSNPVIKILQPPVLEPKTLPREEIVQHALDQINKDRGDFGLAPVQLSTNQAAQAHAEDVFKTKRISHWMTNGEKPYMTYTRYQGEGSVQQNVAIAGFTAEQYEDCRTNILLDCEKIEPLSTIEELEYEMMYKDKECCNDGHKDNILDPHHTHVSIGIVYDQYYLAFVENFENNYGLSISINNGQVRISGQLLQGELEQISIYYDEMPTSATYEQNKHLLSYSAGELAATVVKPLPPGYYYEKPQGYTLIEANRWMQGDSVNVMFDLASAVDKDGVYTLFAMVKDGGATFDVTSYSVFVDSESS